MKPPTFNNWGDIDKEDLDAQSAFETFCEMSFDEAEKLFESNAGFYQEELQSMPKVPFNYYAPALVGYITSDRACGDSDGASSFLNMVVWMLKTQREIIQPETERMLIKAAHQISRKQYFFEADIDIYGEFSEVYTEIQSLVQTRT